MTYEPLTQERKMELLRHAAHGASARSRSLVILDRITKTVQDASSQYASRVSRTTAGLSEEQAAAFAMMRTALAGRGVMAAGGLTNFPSRPFSTVIHTFPEWKKAHDVLSLFLLAESDGISKEIVRTSQTRVKGLFRLAAAITPREIALQEHVVRIAAILARYPKSSSVSQMWGYLSPLNRARSVCFDTLLATSVQRFLECEEVLFASAGAANFLGDQAELVRGEAAKSRSQVYAQLMFEELDLTTSADVMEA